MRRLSEDAAPALLRALSAEFRDCGALFRIEELSSRAWASVTFSGARHKVAFTLEGEGAAAAADSFVARLPEMELELRGHILADIGLLADERAPEGGAAALRIEALTVEDR